MMNLPANETVFSMELDWAEPGLGTNTEQLYGPRDAYHGGYDSLPHPYLYTPEELDAAAEMSLANQDHGPVLSGSSQSSPMMDRRPFGSPRSSCSMEGTIDHESRSSGGSRYSAAFSSHGEQFPWDLISLSPMGSTNPKDRRRAQNRASQRAFRGRQEAKLLEATTRAQKLEEQLGLLQSQLLENDQRTKSILQLLQKLEATRRQLERENATLKASLEKEKRPATAGHAA